jgi:hypothetical protein
MLLGNDIAELCVNTVKIFGLKLHPGRIIASLFCSLWAYNYYVLMSKIGCFLPSSMAGPIDGYFRVWVQPLLYYKIIISSLCQSMF